MFSISSMGCSHFPSIPWLVLINILTMNINTATFSHTLHYNLQLSQDMAGWELWETLFQNVENAKKEKLHFW